MAFDYRFPVADTDKNCVYGYAPVFHHKDWVDGQDVVQAQQTADEEGLNARFRKIEQDIAAISDKLAIAMDCIANLRRQLVFALVDIKAQLNTKTAKEGKDSKDLKDQKDGKDGKDAKDGKDTKDVKDVKDGKDGKDGKDTKDDKDAKDVKDHKDGKDDKDGKEGKEAQWGATEKGHGHDQIQAPMLAGGLDFLWDDPAPSEPCTGRAFIRPDERPPVGQRAIEESDRSGN